MRDKWPRTNTAEGHKKNFDIKCEQCNEDMFMRYSQITFYPKEIKTNFLQRIIIRLGSKLHLAVFPEGEGKVKGNTIEYKCVLCGGVALFSVEDDAEYLQEVLDKRGGMSLLYPTKEEWAKEGEIHRQKLESLGYL